MKIPKKFPVLGIADDGDIVMFTGLNKKDPSVLKGVCIHALPERQHSVGQYMKDWIPAYFKLFKSAVLVTPSNFPD